MYDFFPSSFFFHFQCIKLTLELNHLIFCLMPTFYKNNIVYFELFYGY